MSSSFEKSNPENSGLQQQEQFNHILLSLPAEVYQRLTPNFRKVDLKAGQVLYEPSEPISTVYFPNQCMISLVQVMENGATIEAGFVGNSGMVGFPVYLGGKFSSSRSLVQVSGSAIALDATVLKSEFDRGGALQALLLRYIQAFIAQLSQTAACNRFHSVEERLARWLLQSQDAVGSPNLDLTQDFLASMLGTRRASITLAAGKLQEAQLIHYSRGFIKILNREDLELAACECYKIVRTEYARLINAKA